MTAWANYVEASIGIRETGFLVKSKTGVLRINPWVTVQNKAMEQMKGFLIEFGMTPSSRSRISISEKPEEDNPFILSTKSQDELTKVYRWKALGGLVLFLAGIAAVGVTLNARFG